MRSTCIALATALALAHLAPTVRADPAPPDKPPAKQAEAPKRARAATHRAVVMVLHATNSGRGIDKRIGKMPELEKPPFSSFDTYRLLMRRRLPLSRSAAKKLRLPNGRVLQTELVDVLPRDFVRIKSSINQPDGGDFLPLLEVKAKLGQSFIVAGQSHKNGILVLVIRIEAVHSDEHRAGKKK
jgi:hypothetical protein